MYNILGVIPARIGSKEIKYKNLKEINKLSLLKRTIISSKKSKLINKLILSTESKKIIHHVKDINIEIPFIRSKKLATDKAKTFDVIRDALIKCENIYKTNFDIIVILQPTTPFRKSNTIDKCIKELIKRKADACISIVKTSYPPQWSIVLDKNKKLKKLSSKYGKVTRRQDFPLTFYPSGAVYILTRKTLLKQKTILPNKNTIGVEVNEVESINIDNQFQLEYAKYIANKYKIK